MRCGGVLAAVLLCAAAASGCALVQSPAKPPPTSPPPAAAAQTPAASAPAPPKVVRLIVPRTVKCVPDDVGPPPAYPDTDAALKEAGGAADRYQLMAAGRILREQRLLRLEEVVKRCRSGSR